MKIHRTIYEALVEALDQCFNQGLYADKIVEQIGKEKSRWGARDRRQFAEALYDIVRWWRRLCFCLDENVFGSKSISTDHFKAIVSLWAEQKGYSLQGIEPSLKVNYDLARWDTANERAVRESIPDALDEMGARELGDVWEPVLHHLNIQASPYLRVNTLKIHPQGLIQELAKEDVEVDLVPDVSDALKLVQRKNVFITQAYKKGYFEMQDAGSQLIAPLTAVKSGDRVIDACAGAGGKTLHLAALMKNKGRIVALDVHEWKLKELKKRAARAGVDIVETRTIDSTKVIKRLHGTADVVLLDVPCSGTGTMRRKPDLKWKLTMDEIQRVRGLQMQLLDNYSKMVKDEAGKALVYATCSVLPSENEEQVASFLKRSDGRWKLAEEIRVWPHQTDFDGFYAARLERN